MTNFLKKFRRKDAFLLLFPIILWLWLFAYVVGKYVFDSEKSVVQQQGNADKQKQGADLKYTDLHGQHGKYITP